MHKLVVAISYASALFVFNNRDYDNCTIAMQSP